MENVICEESQKGIVNVNSGSPDETERKLSNFAEAPVLVFDGEETIEAKTVENLIQMMKFPYDDPRRGQALELAPLEAQKLGRKADNNFVYWDGERIPYGSPGHRDLLQEFICLKFDQNPEFLKLLLATGNKEITHEVGPGNPNTSLPKEVFCNILTGIREYYQNQTAESACEQAA